MYFIATRMTTGTPIYYVCTYVYWVFIAGSTCMDSVVQLLPQTRVSVHTQFPKRVRERSRVQLWPVVT